MSQHPTGSSRPVPRRYEGRRVVISVLLGLGLGLLIAFFFTVLVANSPVTLPARKIFWLYMLSAASGVLVGFSIESIRQLQKSSPDPAYHRQSRRSR